MDQRPSDVDEVGHLIIRVSQGDEPALDAVYQATSRSVYGIALRVTHSRDHAEDVSQEVYLDVWRSAARYDASRGSGRSWVNVIAHHRAVSHVRSVQRSHDRMSQYVNLAEVRVVSDPADLTVLCHDSRRLHQALADLSEIHRAALVLAYFDGYTQSEMADLLKIPLGTVKTRVRDALRKLRVSFPVDGQRDQARSESDT